MPEDRVQQNDKIITTSKDLTWKSFVGGVAAILVGNRLLRTRGGKSFIGSKLIKIGIGTATTITLTSFFFGDKDPTSPFTYLLDAHGNGSGISRKDLKTILLRLEEGYPGTVPDSYLMWAKGKGVELNEIQWVKINNKTVKVIEDVSPQSSLGADP